MKQIIENLPFILPYILIDWALMIAALIHILKHKNYRFGNRILWLILVIVIQIFGPILYFTIGRGED